MDSPITTTDTLSEPPSSDNGAAPATVRLAEHPLASAVGAFKGNPLNEAWWHEVQALRARIDQEERDRLRKEEEDGK